MKEVISNSVKEVINSVENAQKVAKEQENPSYTEMFKPWVSEVSEFQVDELKDEISATIEDAKATNERYKKLEADFYHAKARFEAYQLATLNADKATVKKFKKAVAVAIAEVAKKTETAKWFNYKNSYKLGLVDSLPTYMNTPGKLNSYIVKMFTFMKTYQKRSNELQKKENDILKVMEKYGLPRETAEKMYLDGVLKP